MLGNAINCLTAILKASFYTFTNYFSQHLLTRNAMHQIVFGRRLDCARDVLLRRVMVAQRYSTACAMAAQRYRPHGTVPATAWRVEKRMRLKQGAICAVLLMHLLLFAFSVAFALENDYKSFLVETFHNRAQPAAELKKNINYITDSTL